MPMCGHQGTGKQVVHKHTFRQGTHTHKNNVVLKCSHATYQSHLKDCGQQWELLCGSLIGVRTCPFLVQCTVVTMERTEHLAHTEETQNSALGAADRVKHSLQSSAVDHGGPQEKVPVLKQNKCCVLVRDRQTPLLLWVQCIVSVWKCLLS